jgi:uncharacterized protein (DUF433 family)
MKIDEAIRRNPKIMSGALCFAGTRVPVRILFSYLEHGHDIDYFLDGFPSVSREQAVAVLTHTLESLEHETLQAKSA